MVRLLLTLPFILILIGCEKPNPHPELLDPIYRDLKNRKSAVDAELNEATNDLKGAYAAVAEAAPQTGELKRAKRGVQILEDRINIKSQESRYLDILLRERQKHAYEKYMRAYTEKAPWPPKEEYEAYQTVQRLRNAPRSWDSHLPKLKSRIPAEAREKMEAEAKKAAEKSAGGGGGH